MTYYKVSGPGRLHLKAWSKKCKQRHYALAHRTPDCGASGANGCLATEVA